MEKLRCCEVDRNKFPVQEKEVANLILAMGCSPMLSGFNYIRDAIMIAVTDEVKRGKPDRIFFNKGVYTILSQKYQTTVGGIERSIRHCIERCFDRPNLDMVDMVFHGGFSAMKGKATNTEFIYGIVNFLRYYEVVNEYEIKREVCLK